MDHQKDNRQIAETQEMDSQVELATQFYTCPDSLDVWGQLKDVNGEIITLKTQKSYFGRDVGVSGQNTANYNFDAEKIQMHIFERLSKVHFVIERAMEFGEVHNYEPAIITCKGRNGLSVGTARLLLNQRRILKDGEWLTLPPGHKLYQFTYCRSQESEIERNCAIHDSFYIGEVIGKGACGEVRKVTSLEPSKKFDDSEIFLNYAIKCIIKPKESMSTNEDDSLKRLMNEVKIMKRLDYIHVLRLFEVYDCAQQVILVFPFMYGGDLLSKIMKQPLKRLNELESKYFFTQLILGIQYLHSKGITHRDIKPENILLSDDSDHAILSIGDFGLSKMNDLMMTQCGTEYYVAPEVLKKRGHYTNAVDIWSAGVLLFAMMTGKMPFCKNNNGTLRENILSCKFEFSPSQFWERLSTAKNIINFMFQLNPRNRLTASQLIKHRWLCDNNVKERLHQAYNQNNILNAAYDNNSTEELEKTLVNVSLRDDDIDNPPKRQKMAE